MFFNSSIGFDYYCLHINRFHVTSQNYCPPCWCTSRSRVSANSSLQGYKSLQFSIEKMASNDKNSFPSSDPGDVGQIPLSDYAKKLDVKVRERYVRKISCIGIDQPCWRGNASSPTAFRRLNRLICFVIWFWRPAFTRKSNSLVLHLALKYFLKGTE